MPLRDIHGQVIGVNHVQLIHGGMHLKILPDLMLRLMQSVIVGKQLRIQQQELYLWMEM